MTHPFEHDAVQLACDMSVSDGDDDNADWLDWLGHIEG